MDIEPGTGIGGYVVERRLGSGGMGAVYLARHPTLPRHVALKVLHTGLAATPGVRARFEREAELVSRLSHPNVVDVLDRGTQDGLLWIAMQYVAGPDLATVLARDGAAPPERALAIVAAVGAALDHAHACGLVHRDVKPANVLLAVLPGGGERVVLTDFGIGQDTASSSVLTQTGEVTASLAYAAPEQVSGGRVDSRADVYALGAVLFELLTGRRALTAETLPAALYAVVTAPPPDPRAVRPDLPPPITGVLARAMAKDPAHRYGSCAELVAAARGCWPARAPAAETAVGRFPPPPPPPLPPTVRPGRNRLVAGVVAAAVVAVLAVGLLVALAPWRTDSTAAESSPSATGAAGTTEGAATGPWGELQFVVDDFPSLLPATPDGEGWAGGTCVPTSFALDVHADLGLTCQYPNGMTVEVAHYPDVAARDARRAELEQEDARTSPESWGTDTTTRAGVRLFNADGQPLVWQWYLFNQQDKALYAVIAEWAGHTQAELDAAFFDRAPFTGPAGS
ncbi:protein kinase domain-containing protein [Trujillonella humicola]|uniref:serine/threonine-protein kinase n=1 Tax=Trujillonella humicola TaxID=3383699 RepID=UPI00390579E4